MHYCDCEKIASCDYFSTSKASITPRETLVLSFRILSVIIYREAAADGIASLKDWQDPDEGCQTIYCRVIYPLFIRAASMSMRAHILTWFMNP